MRVLIAFVVAAFPFAAQAQPTDGQSAEILLETGTTILGETIAYPTTGPAQVTAVMMTVAPGHETPLHHHGAPLFGYIIEGTLTVDYGNRGSRTYPSGTAVMESLSIPHRGSNRGTGPVKMLVLFMGAEGTQNTIPDTSAQD